MDSTIEVLEVSGYVSEEKAVIASRYLPIKYYCRESGEWHLKKHIEKVCLCLYRCECGLITESFYFI